MNFEKLLSRLDIDNYQDILGHEIISTLNKLNPKYLYKSDLIKVLQNTYSPNELLSNKNIRSILLSLLREEEATALLQELGLKIDTNPWRLLNKCSFSKAELIILFDFFELTVIDEEQSPISVQSEIIRPAYLLYDYQRAVISKIKNALDSNKNRVLLHMPTGSGKTRTAINYVCKHLIEHEKEVVVWFANTNELLEQGYNEFIKAWSLVGNREIQSYKIWGDSDININKIKEGFVVSGLNKAYNLFLYDIGGFSTFASRCSLVIMDEAHQAIAPTYKLLIDSIVVSNKASLIGLSATPGRSWNDKSRDLELADYFYRQKITIKIEGFENPIDYLVNEGYLARIKNTSLLYKSGIKLSKEDYEYLVNNYQLPSNILEQISKDQLRNLLIISKIQELAKIHKRIILFGINKDHAILLHGLLTAVGLKSFIVTSDTPHLIRNKAIQSYKTPISLEPSTKILCNFGILTTGFDAPETSCAVIARPTDSLVLYSQMVGRAVRGKRSGGNNEAEIVSVIDESLPGFGSMGETFMNWDDVWFEL